MTRPPVSRGGASSWGDARRVGLSLAAGSVLLAAVDVVAVVLTVPRPSAGLGLRAAHLLTAAVETVGVGSVAAIALAGVAWLAARAPGCAGARRLFFPLAYFALSTLAVDLAIGDDLRRQAAFTPDLRFEKAVLLALVLGAGLVAPLAHLVGAWLGRSPRSRAVPVLVALAALAVDQRLFRDDFFGLHGAVAVWAAIFAGAALAPLAQSAIASISARRGGPRVLAVAAVVALAGVVVPPPNAVRFELFRQPCAVAPWVLASTLWRSPDPIASAPDPTGPWFASRAGLPPVAPTQPPLVSDPPVVVLVTIDALRADVLEDHANDARLPTFTALRARGAVFTRALAPASQTALSLTSLFTGRYFSELRWAHYGVGETRFHYPAADPSPRLPELLAPVGVPTVIFKGLTFLRGDFGVARGFREDPVRIDGARHANARELIDPLLARLGRVRGGPLFAFTHLLEPHAPYDRATTGGTVHDRYVAEIAIVDAALARVVSALERRAGSRWILVVTADHGEAFGDHGTNEHAKSLYQELVHVPLLVVGPSVAPRVVDTPVGLIDLGATLLDVFGVPVPAAWKGQSLVPLLAGRDAALDRPLLAEGRLRRSLVTPDRVEVIDDPRRTTVEVYDLAVDPAETRNLFGTDPRGDAALRALRRFFAVHADTRGGYRPPYKN